MKKLVQVNLEIAKIYLRNERDKEKAIRYLREAIRARLTSPKVQRKKPDVC